jgi:hypothetical protein
MGKVELVVFKRLVMMSGAKAPPAARLPKV